MHAPSSSLGARTGSMADRAYDELRREARRLEGELESRLQALAKLVPAAYDAPYGSSGAAAGPSGRDSGAEQLAQVRASEIASLLQRLSAINDEMGAACGGSGLGGLGGGGGGGGYDARAHTLARHRDVLAEYAHEFRRLEAAAGAARDRSELFSGAADTAPLLGVTVHGGGNSSGLDGGNGAVAAALRERAQVAASTGYIDDMLAQAASVSRGLMDQRRVFDGVGDKLLAVGERFPAVNGLLNAIRRKKSRDTVVLAAVIAGCVLFLIVYVFFK